MTPPRSLPLLLFGAGGHARVVAATALAAGRTLLGFLDDGRPAAELAPHLAPHLGPLDAAERHVGRALGVVAIGGNAARATVVGRAELAGFDRWDTLVHPNAWLERGARVAPGTVVFAGAVLQPGVEIGEHAIVNTRASVDHDCRVGRFVHLAPGSTLTGGVQVADGAFIGAGATVLPGLTIGAGATVGAGAVVVRSVPPNTTVVGVPARPFDPPETTP